MGLGEMALVLNGVEFRTRHNDYNLLRMRNDSPFGGKVKKVPFPPVPEEVTRLTTVQEQVNEMALWFKAWKDNDYSQRGLQEILQVER